ncbi:MAG TPA: DUF167 domain-containing protein [Polyangiaceae bacterium]|nr:DUF167 domain-containing protein [Polyangiaceae bacterium]
MSAPRTNTVRLAVRAKPRAKRSRVVRADGLSAEIALAAPPTDGAANDELVSFLAGILSVPKSAVTIVLGRASKNKVVDVEGLPAQDVAARLARAAS